MSFTWYICPGRVFQKVYLNCFKVIKKNIDAFYQQSRFLNSANKHFGWLCFEVVNNASHVYVLYMQVMVRAFLNGFKKISNLTLDYIFDIKQVENISDSRHLREFYFKKISEIGIRKQLFIFFFQLRVNVDVLVDIFKNFKPDIDYNWKYFKVINIWKYPTLSGKYFKMIGHFLIFVTLFYKLLGLFYRLLHKKFLYQRVLMQLSNIIVFTSPYAQKFLPFYGKFREKNERY